MKLQKWAWTGIGMAMALGGCERSDTLNEQEVASQSKSVQAVQQLSIVKEVSDAKSSLSSNHISPSGVAELQEAGALPKSPPKSCPEKEDYGVCPYDSGWYPKSSNSFFVESGEVSEGGAGCWAINTQRQELFFFELGGLMSLRLGGNLVQFNENIGDRRFIAENGVLTIRTNEKVAVGLESSEYKAELTFENKQGDKQKSLVRFGCGA